MKHRRELMGAAALLIYFFHGGLPVMPEGALRSIQNLLHPALQGGTDVFFLLSGVGLVYAWEKSENVVDFWLRRAGRMLLPIWLSGVIVAIQWDWSVEEFIRNVSGINFYAVHIFSYSWFYMAIATLYVLFPVYYHFFSGARSPRRFGAVSYGVWFVATIALSDILRRDFYLAFNRVGIFLIGIVLGWMMYHGFQLKFDMRHYVIAAILLGIGIVSMYKTQADEGLLPVPIGYAHLPATAFAVGAGILFLGLFEALSASGGTVGGNVLKIFGFYGMISLEFICAQEWIGTVLERSGLALPDVLTKVLSLFLHTLCAYVYYRLNRCFLRLADERAGSVTAQFESVG